jgi:hypothetical protein
MSHQQIVYVFTMAVLYNVLVNRKESIDEVDILFTSFCCGYGKMSEDDSIQQIMEGIRDYMHYEPKRVIIPDACSSFATSRIIPSEYGSFATSLIRSNIIVNEPNLYEQPKYYQNTEFFAIKAEDIVNV